MQRIVFDSVYKINLNGGDSGISVIGTAAVNGHLELLRWMVLDSGQPIEVTADITLAVDAARKDGHDAVAEFLEVVALTHGCYSPEDIPKKIRELESSKTGGTKRMGGERGF